MSLAERLCGYASARVPASVKTQQALRAMDTLGTIFLVLDALYCAAKVLRVGQIKQLWWPLIIRHIEGAKFVPKEIRAKTVKRVRNFDVAETLNLALESYKRGVRPSPLLVIGLKEELFCGAASSKFKEDQWNQWREDVIEWRRSIQAGVEEKK
ncbi:hypothetical protein EBH_0085660 [Eimeria brunetti]|uniref:Uncharacterized protein n=1 Tax=Eimeria brunetti TaxID=51314 RepID=U6M095_9EIME|nr:hypothetical protein EBH_0085660 [Eimeria brunetti]